MSIVVEISIYIKNSTLGCFPHLSTPLENANAFPKRPTSFGNPTEFPYLLTDLVPFGGENSRHLKGDVEGEKNSGYLQQWRCKSMSKKDEKYYRKLYKDKKILNRDRQVFKAFSKCHIMNNQHFSRMNFSNKSIDRFTKMGVIEKVEYFNKNSQSTEHYFKLTDYGKGYCDRQVFLEKQSYYSSRGIEHDLRMADVYSQLVQDKVSFEWRTEQQLQQEFKDKMAQIRDKEPSRYAELREQNFSAADFSITIEGSVEYVEVITGSGSYSQSHLEAKQNFATVMNTTVQFIR